MPALKTASGVYAITYAVMADVFAVQDTDINGALHFIIIGAESTRTTGETDWMSVRETPEAWRNADDDWVQQISQNAPMLDYINMPILDEFLQQVNTDFNPADIHQTTYSYAQCILYLIAFA